MAAASPTESAAFWGLMLDFFMNKVRRARGDRGTFSPGGTPFRRHHLPASFDPVKFHPNEE
jgi:hypothetical protein